MQLWGKMIGGFTSVSERPFDAGVIRSEKIIEVKEAETHFSMSFDSKGSNFSESVIPFIK